MNAPPSRAAIAAAPFPLAFDRATTALIVIDMQRDFLEPGGFGASLGNDVSRLAAIVPTTRRLIEGCRAAGLPVIHTKECHRPDLSDLPPAKRDRGAPMLRIGDPGPMGRVLIAGEPGTDIVADFAALPGETVIEKPGKGAFYRTDLAGILARGNIRTLVVAGVTTEVCVQTTMREANDRGFECLLVEDATESYFPEFKAATLAMIRAQGGIVGWTAPTDAVLAALATRGAGAEPRVAPGAIAAAPPLPPTSAFESAASAFHGSGTTVVPDLAATFDALPFEPFRPGVEICHLVRGDDTHAGTALLRYQPGTATPRHQHGGLETILVLRGSQQDENGVYPAGTFVANPAGSIHKVSSADGCVVLIQWERPVRMLED